MNMQICKKCGYEVYSLSERGLCPRCEKFELFGEVRDYIRANDVKENDVAEHFGIPVKMVKDWIKEGRIQYKEGTGLSTAARLCEICGKSITFGAVCFRCRKEAEEQEKEHVKAKGTGLFVKEEDADKNQKMRFLDAQ